MGLITSGHSVAMGMEQDNAFKADCTTALISHATKVMLNILQARLQSMWTENFQMYKLDVEKAEEPEIKLPTSAGS